jgi:hypothetical protein
MQPATSAHVIDLRWRPLLLAGVLGGIAAFAGPVAIQELSRPLRVPHVFSERERADAQLEVTLTAILTAAAVLGAVGWAQWKAVQLELDRERDQVVLRRGFPVAWSKRTMPLERAMLLVEQRMARRGGVLHFVVVMVDGERFWIDRYSRESDATRALAALVQRTGVQVMSGDG